MTGEQVERSGVGTIKRAKRASLAGIFASITLVMATACGETGDNATTNVQGGAARAPGAPPPKP